MMYKQKQRPRHVLGPSYRDTVQSTHQQFLTYHDSTQTYGHTNINTSPNLTVLFFCLHRTCRASLHSCWSEITQQLLCHCAASRESKDNSLSSSVSRADWMRAPTGFSGASWRLSGSGWLVVVILLCAAASVGKFFFIAVRGHLFSLLVFLCWPEFCFRMKPP